MLDAVLPTGQPDQITHTQSMKKNQKNNTDSQVGRRSEENRWRK